MFQYASDQCQYVPSSQGHVGFDWNRSCYRLLSRRVREMSLMGVYTGLPKTSQTVQCSLPPAELPLFELQRLRAAALQAGLWAGVEMGWKKIPWKTFGGTAWSPMKAMRRVPWKTSGMASCRLVAMKPHCAAADCLPNCDLVAELALAWCYAAIHMLS